MKTSPVALADLSNSVMAVLPLGRHGDLSIDKPENTRLIRHVEAGGVSTLLYGGNANFYHVGLYEFAGILDFLAEAAAPGSWVIPSVGPDFGKMLDQADVLRSRAFPTAMVMPPAAPMTQAGVEAGVQSFATRFGRPVILYIKSEGQIAPEGVKRLVDAGVIAAVKYAIARSDPKEDRYLQRLVHLIDRKSIVSGMGERPALVHMRDFDLAGFTSGSVCIAPRSARAMLQACRRKDWAAAERLRQFFIPLEDFREKLSFITVLHEAVTLSGIADMGVVLPLLSNLEPQHHFALKKLVTALIASDRAAAAAAAA
ncbi:MAG: dihydrodipicolinate synthase family protein [Proteobacteria bacterium]|nr:dihydrodipicolinate synthase family protein [Pseudomonadota bacterium]MBI3499467.1 dihydrodipicolinate synthase family protein [Pseudomonadota bacterium]